MRDEPTTMTTPPPVVCVECGKQCGVSGMVYVRRAGWLVCNTVIRPLPLMREEFPGLCPECK